MKKALAMLLCSLMLFSVLSGCSNAGPDEQESSSVNEEETLWISPSLAPGDSFAGSEYNLLANAAMDVGTEEASSDPLEDAIYRRNDKLESTYGIQINTLLEPDFEKVNSMVSVDVSAGTGDYDTVYQHMVSAATGMALNDQLVDLTSLNYVDFEQPWWDSDAKEGFMIGQTQFLAVGDQLPRTLLESACIAFNKTQFDDLSWEYPYALARDGAWTLDELNRLTKDQTKDLNGDGKIDYENDYYGLTSWHLDSPFSFFFGSGATFFTKGEDNYPVYEVDQERIQSIYDKVYTTFITNDSLYITDSNIWSEGFKVFASGRALFTACSPTNIANAAYGFKDMADEYGILPQPKYDEDQENYMSFVNGAASVIVVPKSLGNERLEFSGFMMEAMASSSYYMVTDTLYDKVAKSKNVRDQESAEMMDIIIRNRVFDFGYSHFFTKGYPCAVLFMTCLDAKTPSVTSTIKRTKEYTVQKELHRILKSYQGD